MINHAYLTKSKDGHRSVTPSLTKFLSNEITDRYFLFRETDRVTEVTFLVSYSVTFCLGYSVTRLLGYSVTRLLGYSVTPLLRYSIAASGFQPCPPWRNLCTLS